MHWRHRRMRRPAANEPGHVHELTFSCFRGYSFLQAERTCQWLADAINGARAKFNISLWAYVFMPDHVHLLIYPNEPEYDVSAILKAIKQPVGTQAIKHLSKHAPHWLERITVRHRNRIERRFWQAGGGFDRNTIEPHVILAMIDYIHGNPLRKQLVVKPEDWKWSSAGWVEGKNSLRPDRVEFGGPLVAGVMRSSMDHRGRSTDPGGPARIAFGTGDIGACVDRIR